MNAEEAEKVQLPLQAKKARILAGIPVGFLSKEAGMHVGVLSERRASYLRRAYCRQHANRGSVFLGIEAEKVPSFFFITLKPSVE